MFEQFGEIMQTMDLAGFDYRSPIAESLNNMRDRQNGRIFTLQEHVRAMILSMLTSQRPWYVIQNNMQRVNSIFHDFDVNYLRTVNPDVLINELTAIRCGNRQINAQMQVLRYNIEVLERIAQEHGSIDAYYNSENKYNLVMELAKRDTYKLRQLEIPLVSEYLKSMGINIVKPDVHIRRILGRLGYAKKSPKPATIKETFEICDAIANEYGISNILVDSILWHFCAEGQFGICSDKPDCSRCLVTKCVNKP